MGDVISGVASLIDYARRNGARGAEVFISEGDGIAVEAHRGRIQKNEPIRTASITVRCWDDRGGEGLVIQDSAVIDEALIDQAMARAAEADANPYTGPGARFGAPLGGLGIDDRRHSLIGPTDRADIVLQAEKEARAVDRRIRTEPFRYMDLRTHRIFQNSRGVVYHEWCTSYEATGAVKITDDQGEIFIRDELTSRAFASIASIPYGEALATRAMGLLGAGVSLSGPIRVLLPARTVGAWFTHIGALFTYGGIESGESFLGQALKESEGKPVVDPRIHLLDDGTVPGSFRTHAFDDRGVIAIPLALLREGHMEGRYVDLDTARRLDVRPTGHWINGQLQPNNLMLKPGSRSVNVLLGEAEAPVLMVERVDPQFDLVTGDFRWSVSGRVFQNGQCLGAIRECCLTGNVLTVLRSVVEVASDTDRFAFVDAPAMLLDGFTVV